MVATVDLLEEGNGDIGQAWVVIKDQRLASLGQVGGRKGLHVVGVESQGAVDRGQRRQVDLAAVAERHVEGKLEVGEAGDEIMAISLDVQGLGNVGHLHVDIRQVGVVVDVEDLTGLKVDAIEGVELGVANGHVASLGYTVGERQLL